MKKQQMKLESLHSGKFEKLSNEQLKDINGGWTAISKDQHFGISNGNGQNYTGEYGYSSFLGIRTGQNEFRAISMDSDAGWL